MDHEPLLVGVDAGGTSTRAVLIDAAGRCRGYGVGGRGNPVSAGADAAARGVHEAVGRALAAAGRTLGDVGVMVAGMAGTRAVGSGDWLQERLAPNGFTGRLVCEPDLLAAYFSGTAASFGYAVVSGTGACVIRVRDGRIDRSADGLGWLLGDRGSGFWIGRAVARAALEDLDGTGRPTALTDRVLARYGLERGGARHAGRAPELEQLIGALYRHPPVELAALAALAFDETDAVADGILRRAGTHLADTLRSALDGPGPLVIGGGVLSRGGPVRAAFFDRLGAAAERLTPRPVTDGAVGAAVLALRTAGRAADDAVLTGLSAAVAALR